MANLVINGSSVFSSQHGLTEPLYSELCRSVVEGSEPVIKNDAGQSELPAYAGFPILHKGRAYGCLAAAHRQPHQWSERELELLREFAAHASQQLNLLFTQRRLDTAKENLIRSNTELLDLVGVLSHDLASPARGASGCLELLKSELGELEEPASEFLKHALISSRRMIDQISSLNTLQEALPWPLSTTTVSLDRIIEELRESMGRPKYVVKETELGEVVGYEPLIRTLLTNLLSNALKFQPEDQLPKVVVGRDRSGTFYVTDNGIGIEEKFWDKVFSLFTRLNGDDYEGKGLGLAICLRVVSFHNGRIWLESQIGQGTTVRFNLNDL